MVRCHCTEGMVISPAEKLMAEGEGLDPVEVHKWADTWERYLDKALDNVDYDAYYESIK